MEDADLQKIETFATKKNRKEVECFKLYLFNVMYVNEKWAWTLYK